MDIQLNHSSSTPLYMQLKLSIRDKILSGELPEQFKLPSERQMAGHLHVHRNTVVKAYDALVAEGLVVSSHQKPCGYFVGRASDEPEPKQEERKYPLFSSADKNFNYHFINMQNRFDELYHSSYDTFEIPFAGVLINRQVLPIPYLKQIMQEIIDGNDLEPFWFCDAQGMERLRKRLSELLFARNIYIKPRNIQVTGETYEAISNIAFMYLDKGDYVILEEPAPPAITNIFLHVGARLLSVPIDDEGLRMDILEQYVRRYKPKLIYTMPNYQNPSSVTMEFAEIHNLEYKQDELGNVVIYKDGTQGLETHPSLIIQAHIDMICEKRQGYTHDFEKDPLKLYVEDGWIHARGTTLGGDDGVGAAYMMAVLADSSLKHPPLECLFTVQEEVGCAGAAHLKAADFKGTQLLSLDEMSGNATTVSGAGMNRVTARYRAGKEVSGSPFYRLTVGGLLGGHSGDDIHKERGNANKLAGRLLFGLMEHDASLQLSAIHGGTVDNAISRTCSAVFASDQAESLLHRNVNEAAKALREEFKYSDEGIWAELTACEAQPVYSICDSRNIIKFLYICPDGFRHRSMRLELTTSSNLGVIRADHDELAVSIYIRGASKSFVDTITNEILALSGLLNWDSKISLSLPCWEYREDSPLRAQLKLAYGSVTGEELKEHAEHGCLEAGHFTAMKPDMDIATLGPCVKGYHTFDECVDRRSFAQIYDVLTALLERL